MHASHEVGFHLFTMIDEDPMSEQGTFFLLHANFLIGVIWLDT